MSFPFLQAILTDKRTAARKEKLAKIKAGKSTGAAARHDKAAAAAGKAFYKQMIVDSEYVGEDYDEFAQFLAQDPK